MTCHRAREVDFEEYLVDPSAPEWSEFRSHFPGCDDCTAELARLTAFEEELERAADGSHAAPDELLALSGGGRGLSSTQRATLQRHVDGCPRCRDSLRAFEGFDFEAAIASAPRGELRRTTGLDRLRDWLSGLAESLAPGTPAWAPVGVAVAALAVTGMFALWVTGGPEHGEVPPIAGVPEAVPAALPEPIHEATPQQEPSRQRLAEAPVVREPRAPSVPPEGLTTDPKEIRDESARFAATAAEPELPPGVVPQQEATSPRVAEQPPIPTAPIEMAAEPDAPASDPASGASQESILIAMADLPPPTYLAPADALAGMRVQEVLRSTTPDRPELLALALEHVGQTVEASPTLFWFVDRPLVRPVRITLLDEQDGDFIEIPLGDRHPAGIHGVPLRAHDFTLEPGRLYTWFVSLPTQPEGVRPDVLSGGAIQRVPLPESLSNARDSRPAERANDYAASGLWYDALRELSDAIESGAPPGVRNHRAVLLEQAGLEKAAAFDRQRAEAQAGHIDVSPARAGSPRLPSATPR